MALVATLIANPSNPVLAASLGERAAAEARFLRTLALDPGAGYARANLCRLAEQAGDAPKRARYCSP